MLCDGDGIGPEVVRGAIEAIDATGVKIQYVERHIGMGSYLKSKQWISEQDLQDFDDIKVCLKGPLTVGRGDDSYISVRGRRFTSANQVFRKVFNLHANIRPAKSIPIPGLFLPFPNVDLIVVRENTEDVYTGEEVWIDKDTVHGVKRITRGASNRIARTAFEIAINQQRKKVTAIHKSNVCKQTEGLFLTECSKVAHDFPGIEYGEKLADSLLTQMVRTPQDCDVLLCPNLYGDLVSDLAAGLIGSLGLMGSAQFGENHALFEPAHGSAPDIANKGIANPISMLRTSQMMLDHLKEFEAAKKLDVAIYKTLSDGKFLTPDLGGKATTRQMLDDVIRNIH
jgi:isocitrate dehydrogenase (NAD+)